LTLVFASFFLFFTAAQAVEPGEIIINEVAWMGSTGSSADEWIELYNKSQNIVDLGGWQLKAKDGTPGINFVGQIAAGGYFLLERTDDNSVSEIAADQIYTGALFQVEQCYTQIHQEAILTYTPR
jgi:hypothetical protein